MTELIKPCPFCGGEAEVVKIHSGVAMFPYTVVCKANECSASVGVFKETREKAIEAWNNRATEAEIRAKAISDFLKALEEHEQKNWIDHLEYGITWSDLEFVAKKLKGE